MGAGLCRCLIHTDVHVLPQVEYVLSIGPASEEVADERPFVREDLAFEPSIEWLIHDAYSTSLWGAKIRYPRNDILIVGGRDPPASLV